MSNSTVKKGKSDIQSPALQTDSPTNALKQLLTQKFGLTDFRPGQARVIEALMAGHSAAAIFPTGGGKSLCYQLPAALLDGLTLVVSPLLALMREQVDLMNRCGIPSARLDSTLTAEQAQSVCQSLRKGQYKLLYVAPERFYNERFRELIQDLKIALFAVDEAHCISQWGHNFRPEYLKLAKAAKQVKAERVLALTATATPTVLDDICREFSIAKAAAIQTAFYRSNLTLRTALFTEATRNQALVQRLSMDRAQPAIVYVTLQKTAESVAERLQAVGIPAKAYHAGLKDEQRRGVQDWFMQSQRAVVVATIAFGMGIDKASIRTIIHYNPSKSLENYAQEIGRAGRDGNPAVCETLLVPEDRAVLENFAYGDTPSRQAVHRLVEILNHQPQEFYISHYGIAYETDIREAVLRTLLTYLELKGSLESTTQQYEIYRFKPKVDSKTILDHFDDERRKFATSVLSMTVRKKIFVELNIANAVKRLSSDRSRIVKMLDYFAQQGWIDLEVSGLTHGYRRVQDFGSLDALADELYAYLLDRESTELNRVEQLFRFYSSDRCQHTRLSEHFGQPIQNACGHCGVCEGTILGELPKSEGQRIGDSAFAALSKVSKQFPEQLSDRRQQARFLCGLSSPTMIRSRLTRDSAFGCCSSLSFKHVLECLSSLRA